ncbi:hypothetical protein GYMLUDRAFT_156560, partial [Collybiopsis luxurians FD-317 M1]
EKIEYHTHFKRVARTDPVLTIPLLALREESKDNDLDDNCPSLARRFCSSPLSVALSELASSLMGPGPWTIPLSLPLPLTHAGLLPSNKNKRSNVTISHLLKCVIRVEKGEADEPEDKKRKLFDIVVQTPIQILSVSIIAFSFLKFA